MDEKSGRGKTPGPHWRKLFVGIHVDDLAGGIRSYPASPGTSTLLGLAFAQTLVRGALTVLFVVLAVDVLGEDKASSVLLQRVLVFRRHPPPHDWDGVFRLKRFDD